MTLFELALNFASGGAGMVGGFVVVRRFLEGRRRQVEPTCSGYVLRVTTFNYGPKGQVRPATQQEKAHDDCTALRSPTCSDGRCVFHCRSSCRCDGATEG